MVNPVNFYYYNQLNDYKLFSVHPACAALAGRIKYLFIRVDPTLRSTAPVRSTRGAVGLVRFGGQPAVVPQEAIDAIVQREAPDSGLHQDNRPLFCAGEPVRLEEGPLAGMEGIFVEKDGEKRVIVLLELLGKANKIRINRDWVVQSAQ